MGYTYCATFIVIVGGGGGINIYCCQCSCAVPARPYSKSWSVVCERFGSDEGRVTGICLLGGMQQKGEVEHWG